MKIECIKFRLNIVWVGKATNVKDFCEVTLAWEDEKWFWIVWETSNESESIMTWRMLPWYGEIRFHKMSLRKFIKLLKRNWGMKELRIFWNDQAEGRNMIWNWIMVLIRKISVEEEFGENWKCNDLYWQICLDQMKGGFGNCNLKAASTTRSTATTTTTTPSTATTTTTKTSTTTTTTSTTTTTTATTTTTTTTTMTSTTTSTTTTMVSEDLKIPVSEDLKIPVSEDLRP